MSTAQGVSETQTPIDISASTCLNLHPHLDIQSFFITIYFLFSFVWHVESWFLATEELVPTTVKVES